MHETSHIDAEMWDKQARQWPLAGIGMFQHIARSSAFSVPARLESSGRSWIFRDQRVQISRDFGLFALFTCLSEWSQYKQFANAANKNTLFPGGVVEDLDIKQCKLLQSPPIAAQSEQTPPPALSLLRCGVDAALPAIECETAEFYFFPLGRITLASIQIHTAW
ncbi:hypothetical protein CIHG_02078 [Coccidioides immitis H538.4]|uniref:Uncharacterized protein n=1 Tax=Coccidioides immitis H538.4 TaxID=396776 RepID=A0A0J8RHE1_COCIT|nr:hypothetical protein CIHG_02078 [Coccidioides immitis H538.4]